MPKEQRPLDVEALLYWLIEKFETHIAGGDKSFRTTSGIPISAMALNAVVDSDPGDNSQTIATGPTLPGMSTNTATASDTPESETPITSIPIPGMTTSTQVIP